MALQTTIETPYKSLSIDHHIDKDCSGCKTRKDFFS